MGKQHANRLLIASDKLSAHEAYVSGLVTQVIAKEGQHFVDDVCAIARRIGGYSGESLKVTKELVNREGELVARKQAGKREGVALKKVLSSPEAMRVMAEFASKSKRGRAEGGPML